MIDPISIKLLLKQHFLLEQTKQIIFVLDFAYLTKHHSQQQSPSPKASPTSLLVLRISRHGD